MINDTPRWLLALGTALVILGTVLVILSLASCAPPPPADTATLDGATLREAVSPPWLWRGADHPEWASCRLEPPSALCTER